MWSFISSKLDFISQTTFQVLLLSETQKNEEENHQEVESVKAHYDILISVREAQHRDEISRINNDNKNEIEKLMEENFIQTESNLRNFKAQKDVIEQSFHDETLRNEAIVDGLQKRIRKMEKHSILTLNSLSKYKDSPYLFSSKCVCTVVIGMIHSCRLLNIMTMVKSNHAFCSQHHFDFNFCR